MREVVVVSSVRTPVGRAFKGTLRATRPDELAAVAIKGALDRVPQLDPKEIEDVILGCAMPEAEQGMNVARIASLRAGLPVEVSAVNSNRFVSAGLQGNAMAAERISARRAPGSFDCAQDRLRPGTTQASEARNFFQSRRGPARRYFDRGSGRAQGCVSREGRDHSRKFFADVGRRRGGSSDVGGAGEGSGPRSAGALRRIRDRRIQAGRDGTGAGVCDS